MRDGDDCGLWIVDCRLRINRQSTICNPTISQMTATTQDIPRWASELGEDLWIRINELIDGGWATPDILRELKIPTEKLRSLQVYVRRTGPRRRLMKFGEFKDALLGKFPAVGAKMMQSLSVIAELVEVLQ